MKYINTFIFTGFVFFVFMLCGCDDNRFDTQVPSPRVRVEWLRFDQDFYRLGSAPYFDQYNDSMTDVYGRFYELYAERVMNFGDIHTREFTHNVMGFLHNPQAKRLFDNVNHSFVDISTQHAAIETAFTFYYHYFSDKPIPIVVSMVAGLNRNIMVTDSVLAVGLDMYLGKSDSIYDLARLPEFIRDKCSPDYLVYDIMRGWILSEFEPIVKGDDVLSQIIYYGRSIYVMDAIFPDAPDYYKIGFTSDQIKWCSDNEYLIWSKIIEEELLYSTDIEVIRSLTGPGPFTAGFPRESPAQIGYWVGWQIVRAYMDENRDVSLAELMKIEDIQSILRQSKYKPKRFK